MRIMRSLVLTMAFVTLVACGSSAKVDVDTQSKGDDLIALDKAYKDGLLDEHEYKKQREEILKRKD